MVIGDLVVRVLSSCGSEVSLTLGRLKSVGEGVDDNTPRGEKAVTCEKEQLGQDMD